MASVEAISFETSSIEDSETVSASEVKRPSIPLRDKYSLRGFMKYLQGNPWDMVLSVFFLFMGYELKMFGNSYSIDTEAMMQVPENLYRSWVGLERFGLLALKKVLGLYWYNNAVASFLTAMCLLLAALLWAYLLAGASNLKGKFHPAFFTVPFVASPILAEMVGFTLTGAEIGIALGLVACSLMLLLNSWFSKKWWVAVLSCLTAFAAFTLYLAMVTVFITGVAMVFLVLFWDDREHDLLRRFVFIFVAAGIFVFAYAFYKVANAAAMKMYHVTTNAYISDQSSWGKGSIHEIAHAILSHAVTLYSGEGIYYSVAFPIVLGIFLAAMGIAVSRKHADVLMFIVALCVCASPMMMSVVLGGNPSTRTEMSYPLAFSFVLSFLAVWASVSFTKERCVKWLAIFSVLAIGWSQALIVNRIFYTEATNHQQDMELAQEIRTRIDELNIDDQSEVSLVFLNYHKSACNKDCYTSDQLGLVGRSLFEVTVSPEQGTFVKTNFLNITGTNFAQASTEQIEKATEVGRSMPHWPAKGSVVQKDDFVIVNF